MKNLRSNAPHKMQNWRIDNWRKMSGFW